MLQNKSISWDQLIERGASASEAASEMRCSRRTALKSLKAAAGRAQLRLEHSRQARDVSLSVIGTAGERSNWPRMFVEMAEKIDREGEANVSDAERRMVLRGVPRTVGVA